MRENIGAREERSATAKEQIVARVANYVLVSDEVKVSETAKALLNRTGENLPVNEFVIRGYL